MQRWRRNEYYAGRMDKRPLEAKRIADKALTWCENLRLQKYQTEKRLEWYMSLWNRRDELTKDLLQRVPELKI